MRILTSQPTIGDDRLLVQLIGRSVMSVRPIFIFCVRVRFLFLEYIFLKIAINALIDT